MSEEEIINKWFEKNMCVSFKKFTENWEEQQELTNYLQQENSQLKERINMCKNINKKNKELNKRIEKAIDYIQDNKLNTNKISEMLCGSEIIKLLEILKGDE